MKKLKITQKEYLILSLFYDWCNRKGIEFPSHSKDWKKFEQNNKTIAFNILFVPYNTKQITQVYISKYNDERNNQAILLIIANDNQNWHYLAVKSLSRLFRGITSNHIEDFHYFKCFHSCRAKERLRKHEKVCKYYDCCYVINARHIDTCQNDPKKSSTEKINWAYPFKLLMGHMLFIW